MTKEQLERGKELEKEIRDLRIVTGILERSVDFERNGGREKVERNGDRFLSFLRFVNCKNSSHEPEEAHIFLFRGTSIHGTDLPVDLEIVEEIRGIIQRRLNQKESEFAALGGDGK